MMKTIFFCLLMTISLGGFSQITERNLLQNNWSTSDIEKYLISKEEFKPYPKTPEEWAKALPSKTILEVIKQGEAALEYEFIPISGSIMMEYKRSGDRSVHQEISFGKRENLMHLVLAESMEGKGRFSEAIFNGIWSICEESYWGVPAHISHTGLPDIDHPYVDLFQAETAGVLALADYLCGPEMDKINPLIRKRIYSETNSRIFMPMIQDSENYGYMSKTKPVNNWNPWIMSNWLLSTLLLEPEESRRHEMVYRAMVGLDSYLNSLGDDGGCDEGPSYWFAAGGSVFDCLELLDKSTSGKVNIYQEPLIQNMSNYIYKTHIDESYFVNFADADPTLDPDGLLLYRLGEAIDSDPLATFGQWAFQQFGMKSTHGFMRMRTMENLLTISQIPTGKVEPEKAKTAWFEDIQVLVARNKHGLFLATHGGHNAESHNHNDVGDFIIYQDGQPMIIDAGRGNYTARTFSSERYTLWFTRSDHHNVPLINGVVQENGRSFEATEVEVIENAKETALQLNMEKAYPESAGIKSWKRKISISQQEPTVSLTDVYDLSKTKSLQQVFMTICAIESQAPGELVLISANGEKLRLSFDPKMWEIDIEEPSSEGMEYSAFKTRWGGEVVKRILFENKNLKKKDNYSFEFRKVGD
ncbi:heparinase II/III family protein [Jiulongibacter sediminis]|uniref:heparinase II/III domain-containing protein n=1 Tax=Jiulongibacter sediminis TaxID=1605367 RepID=UPI0026EB191F|nr:heparinase II/III family protein [Jiulongibacter sediminis]